MALRVGRLYSGGTGTRRLEGDCARRTRTPREQDDVSDHNISDLDDLIRQLDLVDTPSPVPEVVQRPVRLVVATDWSDAAAPLAVLGAYRAIVPRDYPVQLVFALPHELGADDAECVHVLLEGVGSVGDMSGLELMSFDEVREDAYDTAVVPTGDARLLMTEVAGLIVRMHDLIRRMDRARDEGRSVSEDVTMNAGSQPRLRDRLSQFSA